MLLGAGGGIALAGATKWYVLLGGVMDGVEVGTTEFTRGWAAITGCGSARGPTIVDTGPVSGGGIEMVAEAGGGSETIERGTFEVGLSRCLLREGTGLSRVAGGNQYQKDNPLKHQPLTLTHVNLSTLESTAQTSECLVH